MRDSIPLVLAVAATALSPAAALAQPQTQPQIQAQAQAQATQPEFPAALDEQALTRWLAQRTDLAPGQVVAVSRAALTAVKAVRPGPSPGRYVLTLQAEAIDPALHQREGFLSWTSDIEVDCPARQVRQGPTTAYAGRNLQQDGRPVAQADPDWKPPRPETHAAAAWRSVCDRSFVGPLQAPGPRYAVAGAPSVASTAPPSPPSASAAEARTGRLPTDAVEALLVATELRPTLGATLGATLGPRPRPPALTKPAGDAPAPGGGRLQVQVGAGTSRSGAETDLRRLLAGGSADARDLRGQVQEAVVNNSTVYRQIVFGFRDRDDALAYCRALEASRRACFLRGPSS